MFDKLLIILCNMGCLLLKDMLKVMMTMDRWFKRNKMGTILELEILNINMIWRNLLAKCSMLKYLCWVVAKENNMHNNLKYSMMKFTLIVLEMLIFKLATQLDLKHHLQIMLNCQLFSCSIICASAQSWQLAPCDLTNI